MCIFDPDLCVYCVSVCMMTLILNDLEPQNTLGGYTLSIILYNAAKPRATQREAEREAETQVICSVA